jgi:hypothetical protein
VNSHLHRRGGVVLAGVLAASILGVTPSAYAANGTISGTVTGAGGPLSTASVQAYVLQGGSWLFFDDGYGAADAGGHYTLSLPPGEYRLGFDDWSGAHVEEFYLDAATVEDADTITVVDGPPQVFDADLATASHITGTVTDPVGAGLESVSAVAYQEQFFQGESYWQAVEYADTDASGDYDLGGLVAGTYRVGFEDGAMDPTYASEFFQNKPSVLVAQDVAVGPAGAVTSGVDAVLDLESTISGTVTDVANAPLAGVNVYAYVQAGAAWDFAGYETTNPSGVFTFDGLPTGTYRIEYEYESGPDFFYEYWNNKGSFDEADDIVVGTAEAITGRNAQLVLDEHEIKYLEGVTIPMISGTPQVGSTLTVTDGTWTPADITATYQWFRDEGPIAGATASTYTLTAADEGKTLVVLVNASKPGYQDRMNMSNAVGPIAAAPAPPVVAPAPAPALAPAPAPVPVISFSKKIDVTGALVVGSTLKLKNYKALVTQVAATATYKIQWYAGTKKIKKATKSKLKVAKALEGKKINVKVSATVGSTTKTVKVKVGKIR